MSNTRKTYIKENTTKVKVSVALADLKDHGDASAMEKHYHRRCLEYEKCTTKEATTEQDQLVKSMIDQQMLTTVRNTITYIEQDIIRMADVNEKD